MSIRSYVLGSRGIGLSFVGLFTFVIGLIVGVGLYTAFAKYLDELTFAASFLTSDIGAQALGSMEKGGYYMKKAQEYMALLNSGDMNRIKSAVGLLSIGAGVFCCLIYTLDFLLTYLIVLILSIFFGNGLTAAQQGRLLVVPWIIFTIICTALTFMKKMVFFWWLTLTLRIISPNVPLTFFGGSSKAENVFAFFVPMWWISLVAFVVFVAIYLFQAKGLALYRERRNELLKKPS